MYIKEIKEEELVFDNGLRIVDYHNQECCENVYVDWKYLEQYNVLPKTGETISIYEIEFDDDIQNHIEFEKDMGIKLVAKDGSKWFIPCYNEQNGYYSDDLYLEIYLLNKQKVTIDISEYVEDRIY